MKINLRKIIDDKVYLNSLEEIHQYSKIKNREIQLNNSITIETANMVDELIRYWNREDEENVLSIVKREPIKIYINSTEGSIGAALTIMDSINLSKTPVYTYNIGSTYQKSFLIYLAGHRRFCYENALFFYNHSEILSNTIIDKKEIILHLNNNIRNFILDKINISNKELDKLNNKWFSAEDAVDMHICNEICIKK